MRRCVLAGLVAVTACSSPPSPPAAVDAARSSLSAARTQAVANDVDAVTITVVVRDGTGTPLAGRPVAFAATGDGNTLSPSTGTTGADGVLQTSLVSTVAGAKEVSATADGVAVTARATVTFVAGPAARLAFVEAPSSGLAGEALPSAVVALADAHGNPVADTGTTVTVALSGPAALLSGTRSAGTTAGRATFADLSIDRPGTGFALSATSAGLSGATSAAFSVGVAWTAVGPEGGSIDRVALDPASPAVVYAVAGDGIFRSPDAGATWTRLVLPPVSTITGVVVKGGSPSTIYGAAYEGILRSTDDGATWALVGTGLPTTGPYALALLPDGAVLASTMDGVYRSDDGGDTWTSSWAGGGTSQALALLVDPVTPATVYAGSFGTVYLSDDSAATWSAATLPSGAAVMGLTANTADPRTLYAALNGSPVCTSADGGATWATPSGAPTATAVAFDAGGSNVYAAVYGGGIWRSTSGGAFTRLAAFGSDTGWTDEAYGDSIVNGIAADPTDANVLYAGTAAGVVKTADGGATWVAERSGLSAHGIVALAADPSAPRTLYASALAAGRLFKSTDGGATWGLTGLNMAPRSISVDPTHPQVVYAAESPYWLMRTTDGGGNWAYVNAGVVAYAVAVAPDGSVYVGTGTGVLRSTDGGVTFPTASSGLPSAAVSVLSVAPSAPATAYAATGTEVYRTVDGGGAWKATGALSGDSVVAVAVDPLDASHVFAATAARVFRSADGGVTWSAAADLPGWPQPYSMALDPSSASTLYVGTVDGVFKSTDSGASWRRTASGLASRGTWALLVDSSDPLRVYAGTSSGGVYLSTTGGE